MLVKKDYFMKFKELIDELGKSVPWCDCNCELVVNNLRKKQRLQQSEQQQ